METRKSLYIKNIFARLLSVYSIIRLSCPEEVCVYSSIDSFSIIRQRKLLSSAYLKKNMPTWIETMELADLNEENFVSGTN